MKPFLAGPGVAVFMTFYLLVSPMMSIYATDILGVNELDWALYKVESTWHSSIPGDSVSQYLKDINHTEWRLQVLEVVGESARLSVTKSYHNGTKKVEFHEGNVRTGYGNLSMWVVRKNLNVTDLVCEEKELAVNSTKPFTFAGVMREAVYAWFAQEEGEDATGIYAIFWDKETGILCGEVVTTEHLVSIDWGSVAAIRISIVETSLWGPPSDDFWLLALAVIVAVLVLAIVVYVQRRRKLKRRKSDERFTG